MVEPTTKEGEICLISYIFQCDETCYKLKVIGNNNLLVEDKLGDILDVSNIGSLAAGQVTPNPGGHPNILRLEATNQVCLPFIHSRRWLIWFN